MNCDLDRIEALHHGTLPASECEAVRAHMKDCPACRVWYAALEELDREVPAPTDFTDRVMAQVRTTPSVQKKTNRRWLRSVATVAACLVLVTVLGFGPLRGMLLPGGENDGPVAREVEPTSAPYSDISPQTLQQWLEGLEGAQAVAGNDQTEVVLTPEQSADAREWLRENQCSAQAHSDEGSGYCLREEEAEAFRQAIPNAALPESGTLYVYLPK